MIDNIKQNFSDSEIDLLVYRGTGSILEHDKNITEMIPYCMWSNANTTFKKNIISGITKMLGQYIITNDLKKIAEKDKKVKIIINTRNFGHIRSPIYGMLQATGDACILMK